MAQGHKADVCGLSLMISHNMATAVPTVKSADVQASGEEEKDKSYLASVTLHRSIKKLFTQ